MSSRIFWRTAGSLTTSFQKFYDLGTKILDFENSNSLVSAKSVTSLAKYKWQRVMKINLNGKTGTQRKYTLVGNSASVKMLQFRTEKVKLENVTLLAARKTQIIGLKCRFSGHINNWNRFGVLFELQTTEASLLACFFDSIRAHCRKFLGHRRSRHRAL